MTRPTAPTYTAPAIALHWVLALALLTSFGVGLYMADLPFSPQRVKLYNWHKWAGVTILLLSTLRLPGELRVMLQEIKKNLRARRYTRDD